MKQYNDDIVTTMDKVLEQHTTSVQFEAAWNRMLKSKGRIFGLKKIMPTYLIALISILALLMVGFTSYKFIRNIDRTDYPFIDDERVKGKWESVDFVSKIDDFNPENKSFQADLFITSLVFIKDGKMLSSVDNGNLAYTAAIWTKDKVLNKQEKTASDYLIEDINGTTYMFFEWKSGDYVFRSLPPGYYVLKKIDSDDYSNYQVKSVKEDNLDYPFVDDSEMKGKWNSVDFVKTIDSFSPEKKYWLSDLFLTAMEFDENGKLTFKIESKSYSGPSVTWTKGLIIDKQDKTASKCEIKEINGATYMFYEWKSGDYVYRGMEPYYYVLKKVE